MKTFTAPENSTALFIGRFQPFHNGHLDIIKRILLKHGKVIIVVGSAEKAGEKRNPFSAPLRKKMIIAALKESKISSAKYKIIPLKDINNPPHWAAYILKNIPKVQTLYTGSKFVKTCFSNQQSIKITGVKKNIKINGTKIRSLIAKNENWKIFVPKSVAKIISSK